MATTGNPAEDLAAIIKDTFYESRDNGGTMHTAAELAATRILEAGWSKGPAGVDADPAVDRRDL